MLYSLVRPLLFRLDPEHAHTIALKSLYYAQRTGLARLLFSKPPAKPTRVMGLKFPNPVGLAAGLDKNGEYIAGLASLGFGFIEVGTVTPLPQAGNPQPRLFRLPEARALINRMGFNNQGIDYLLEQVRLSRYKGILGINIGKNASTPLPQAVEDYLIGLRKAYVYADYITINISSPNTAGLRQLQEGEDLDRMLSRLKQAQQGLAVEHGRYVPLAIKIAPDLTAEALHFIAAKLLEYQLDGVIATNTTLAREAVQHLPHGTETGGLSGAPLTDASTAVIRQLHDTLGAEIPIIAAGGIMNAEDARAKFAAGAALVQVYTGLIYRGPRLVKEIVRQR